MNVVPERVRRLGPLIDVESGRHRAKPGDNEIKEGWRHLGRRRVRSVLGPDETEHCPGEKSNDCENDEPTNSELHNSIVS